MIPRAPHPPRPPGGSCTSEVQKPCVESIAFRSARPAGHACRFLSIGGAWAQRCDRLCSQPCGSTAARSRNAGRVAPGSPRRAGPFIAPTAMENPCRALRIRPELDELRARISARPPPRGQPEGSHAPAVRRTSTLHRRDRIGHKRLRPADEVVLGQLGSIGSHRAPVETRATRRSTCASSPHSARVPTTSHSQSNVSVVYEIRQNPTVQPGQAPTSKGIAFAVT